jgi:DNA-binding NarL/FixJ family response regulator
MRVVVADDSVLLREGVELQLTAGGGEVVGHAGDGEDLLRKVGAHRPDVAIVDVRMPPTHTDEGLRAAAADRPRAGRRASSRTTGAPGSAEWARFWVARGP